MLTAQKRKYALALMSGMSQKDAAIKAGYSEKSARSKGSQLAKDPEVIAFIERKKREKVEVDDEPAYRRNVYTPAVNTPEEKRPPAASSAGEYEDPLDFLKSVMNNVGYEIETRKDAAKAMLPYQINPDNMAGIESSVTVPAREVIHDRFNCLFHPLIGLSPIYAAGLAAMQGHHIQESSAYFFRNGGKPSGVIEVPGSITEENARKIKENWDTGYTGENAGKTAILSNGAKYVPRTVSAADAQTVEQLRMTAQIVCSVFHVPAYKVGIGELPTHDNIEAQDQQYYSQCLQSLIESIELLLDEAFELEGDTGTEFDVNALLRMDSERRIKSLGEGVKNTILTPNEARKSENLPPLAGGDSLYLQQQNFSLEALARRDASDDPFGKSSLSQPSASTNEGKALTDAEQSAAKAMIRGFLTK